jgi:hypothetical protein
MDDAAVLLAQIEAACRDLKMAQTTFGRLAVNDGKLVSRLQQGGQVTLQTVDRVHRFIEAQTGEKAIALRSAIRGLPAARTSGDFRFYDNRQKYLMFVNTTSEKQLIADRALAVMAETRPQPPAMRLLDAGGGDGTAIARIMRGLHRRNASAPFYMVIKEISMENIRLVLEKMADRLQEHPATVLVLTNLRYTETLSLEPSDPAAVKRMVWKEVALEGASAGDFEEQIAALDPWLGEHWAARISSESGSPVYSTPVVLVLYRRDHKFALSSLVPQRGHARAAYDFILLSQPYRARAPLTFKTSRIITPLVRGLRAHGKLMGVQGYGNDAGMELIREVWPGENPFTAGRSEVLAAVRDDLGDAAGDYQFHRMPDAEAVFSYSVRTLPNEIDASARMGSSTIMAAWNAATYAAQIDDERLAEVMVDERYREATRKVLLRHDGLWFNDELFVITRRF